MEFIISIIKSLSNLGIFLAFPPAISALFSGIKYFLPNQSDFQKNHEELIKTVLKKKADALIKFVASVEFLPDSIMEVKDVRGEELINNFDKFGLYKKELETLDKSFYKNESCLKILFFIAIFLLLISFIHPYIGAITFLLGILLIVRIFFISRILSKIIRRLHELKINPDLI